MSIPKTATHKPEQATVSIVSKQATQKYRQFMHELLYDGFSFSLTANQIDMEVAQETPCPECGGTCRYEAWRRTDPRGYRAVSVCGDCQAAYEF